MPVTTSVTDVPPYVVPTIVNVMPLSLPTLVISTRRAGVSVTVVDVSVMAVAPVTT